MRILMAKIIFPNPAELRGPGFWLQPKNWLAARRKYTRLDYSGEWRKTFGEPNPADRSVPFTNLLQEGKNVSEGFRFIVVGDTGEGDNSQYSLIPLFRTLQPDFMIINGDIAYPAARMDSMDRDTNDFIAGFFEPYRNLQCTIWSTPGDHEYFSPHKGKEYYHLFCTHRFDRLWERYGLRHVPQPGTFWELRDNSGASNLVVLGLDTGMKANMDDSNDWWQIWKRHIEPDHEQHDWLDGRLKEATKANASVIVLFHIPALLEENHKEKYLTTLHKIIAQYKCIRLVVCGHEHNFQYYSPDTFQRYLTTEHLRNNGTAVSAPHYAIAGGGGAYLESTDYKTGSYQSIRYPDAKLWSDISSRGRKIIAALNMQKTLMHDITESFVRSAVEDGDLSMYLSFLMIDVKTNPLTKKMETKVTPVFLDDLNTLFAHLSDETTVDVTMANPPIDPTALQDCIKTNLAFQL